MLASINITQNFMTQASRVAEIEHRSLDNQIEHWAKIGKIMEDNPDLSYSFVKQILLAKTDIERGDVVPFAFE